jgi:ferritin
MLTIKQFINQISTNAKTKNKKKALEVLVRHFQEQNEEYDLDDSIDNLYKKWKDLENLYRT